MASQRSALITGIFGQDGSYLTQHLLGEGYRVAGFARRITDRAMSVFRADVGPRADEVAIHLGDLRDVAAIMAILEGEKPEEVYNLGALSFVPDAWEVPAIALATNTVGTLNLLMAVREKCPQARVYHACSSEMFEPRTVPLVETDRMIPTSFYGISKLASYHIARQFREASGMFIACGIAFNHESPRRDIRFLSRKVCRMAAMIACGLEKAFTIGNIDPIRDWGFAGEYVVGMAKMLAQSEPLDCILATGTGHTPYNWILTARDVLGLPESVPIRESRDLRRANEARVLVGNPSLAARELGWQAKVSFHRLVEMMVKAEMDALLAAGHKIKKGRKS
jgi:GDPmannose 4,6-dehydratase